MTLGWFWCFGWYHISQRAAGSRLTWHIWPRKVPPFLVTTLAPLLSVPLPALILGLPGRAKSCESFSSLCLTLKNPQKPIFFKSGIQRIPRRWGGLLWVPDPGSSKLPGHFMLNNSLLAHKSSLTCLLSGLFLPCLSDQNNPRDKQGFFYHYHQ